MRAALILKNPVPFHRPILSSLSQICDLRVAYLSTTRANSQFQDYLPHPGEVLGSRPLTFGSNDVAVQIPFGVRKWLDSHSPDVVMVHSFDPASALVAIQARRKQIPVAMWSESTNDSGRFRGRWAEWYREWAVRNVDAHLANGTAAAEFLECRKVDPNRIVCGIYPVEDRKSPGRKFSSTKNGASTVGYLGRLIESKRPDLFVSIANILTARSNLRFVCYGDGPLRADLEHAANGSVGFHGFVNGAEVPGRLAEIDVLVVPSDYEVWSLAVNEALLAGTFVLASRRVGAARDLISEGENGLLLDSRDPRDWAAAVQSVTNALDISHEGRVARRRASLAFEPRLASPSNFAASMLAAMRIAREGPSRCIVSS